MGKVRIRDGEDEVDSFLTRWEGTIILEVDPGDSPRVVVSEDAPFSPPEVEIQQTDVDAEAAGGLVSPYWLLVAPTIAAVISLLAGLSGVVGILTRGTGLEVAVLLTVFTVMIAGTTDLWMYNDAEHLRAIAAAWQPNPWLYFATGSIVFTVGATLVIGLPGTVTDGVSMIGGLLLLGGVLSSAVTGPIYLVNRFRTVGLE